MDHIFDKLVISFSRVHDGSHDGSLLRFGQIGKNEDLLFPRGSRLPNNLRPPVLKLAVRPSSIREPRPLRT